jgi:ABC-type phosphate/phosphonate transport system substrate-binding protein
VWFSWAFLVLGVGLVPQGKAQPPLPEVKIGLLQSMFKDVSPAMVKSAAIPFQKMLQKLAGLKGDVEMAPDYKELAQRLQNGKIDIAVFHGFEYSWVKNTPGMTPLVVTVPECGKVQACLVIHANSKAVAPKNLKGACVAVPRGCKAHCEMFLERLRADIPVEDCCPCKCGQLTSEEALFAVANEKQEAVLVDVSSLLTFRENWPAAAKNIKVLAQSEELPSAVIVYRQGALKPEAIASIRKGLIDCVKTPTGQLFVLFWQLKGFKDADGAYNKLVNDALKAYPPPEEKVTLAPPPKGPK